MLDYQTEYGDPLSEECYEAGENHIEKGGLHDLCRSNDCNCHCHFAFTVAETLYERRSF